MVDQNKTISLSDFPFDIDAFKPGHPEVEIFDRGSENEEHRFSIKGPNEKYCIISEDEKFAFDLMNGERTIDEIAALFMEQRGTIAVTMIRKLTLRLWTEGLLDTGGKSAPVINDSDEHKRLMILPVPAKALSKVFAPLIGITLLNPLSVIALIVLGGYGCYLINEIYSQPMSIPALFTYQGNPVKGMGVMFLSFIAASLIRYCTLIAAYGGKRINISRSGLMIGQILPGFYIEGPGITALKAKSRFFVRISGIIVLFGVSGLLLILFKHGGFTPEIRDLLFQGSIFFLIYIIYQCCPLLDNDVYLGCADYLDEPYLRKSSFAFVSRHIKKFFSPNQEEKGDNVIYIMFCAGAILWLAFSAQMVLSAISQNAKIISGLFVEKQSLSSQLIIFITLFPVLCALLASIVLVYKFLTKSISSQEVFKNTRNQIIFCSVLLLGFLMLLRIASPVTRFYFHVLMSGFAFYLVMWHSISISKKLKGSSTSTQFIFMSLIGLIGLAFSIMSAFNSKSGHILLIIYTAALLIYSLFNIKHEWGEFLNRKRNSLAVIAIMILITAACMYISKDLQKESLNISFNRKQKVDMGIVNDRAFAMYCLIAGALSLILNIPGIIYRKSTQSFAPNFAIVFGSHMILYFLVIMAFSKNIFPIIESITACSFLLILGVGAMKTALNSKHYIEPYPLKTHNEKETLVTAFKFILDNMMRSIKEDFGEYRCGIISNKFNRHAAKVGWTFTLEEPADEDNINTLGNVYDQSFAIIKKLCEEECGKSYTDEMINEIDDHFHSTAREIVNRRVNSFTHNKEKKTHLNLTKEKKGEIIKDVILFQNIEEADKDQLLDCLHSVSYEVGDLIIKQHDDGDRLFIMAEGKAQVEIEDLAGNSNVVSYLSENEFFGEIALLTSSERTASVRAIEKCTVLYLKKKDFDTFLGLNPEKKEKIMSTLDYLRLIKAIPLFRGISSSVINLFASQMVKEEFKKGENIIKQGEEGDKFYVILDGTVSVHVVRDDNKDHQVATLSNGEYFGEIALFKNIPRTATITVDSDSATVLSLQKEHFVKAIDNQNSLEINLENVTHRRIVQMMG